MQFRVYCFDPCDRVSDTFDLEAWTLDDALQMAGAHRGEHPRLELWRLDEAAGWCRLVETVPSTPSTRH